MYPATIPGKALRRWELALLLGIGAALLLGMWLHSEQNTLADKVIRLHVIANSDAPADQALKLQVRDRVLEEAELLISTDGGLDTARASVEEHMDELSAAAAEAVRAAGYDYPVAVSLDDTWFPTKQYDGFAFPAGRYTALRIVIGEGQGQNWWCVLFPPLCLNTVTETVAEAASEGGLSEEDISLITGSSEGYIIKFKAIELWEKLQEKLS